jgi:hypothetical protein
VNILFERRAIWIVVLVKVQNRRVNRGEFKICQYVICRVKKFNELFCVFSGILAYGLENSEIGRYPASKG